MTDQTETDLISLTTEIVSAYVGKNHVAANDLPSLIASVHGALTNVGSGAVAAPTSSEPLKPAVPIRKSITADGEYIISLEDGRKFKSMRRYLSGLGMTPEQYRAKWGLPKDYPTTAPAYAAKRSALAKELGLGKGGRKPVAKAKAAPTGRK
jgi:predicted transcriptional regulator